MTKSLNDTGRFFVLPQLKVATQHQYSHFSMWLHLMDLFYMTHTCSITEIAHFSDRSHRHIQHVQDEALTSTRIKLWMEISFKYHKTLM